MHHCYVEDQPTNWVFLNQVKQRSPLFQKPKLTYEYVLSSFSRSSQSKFFFNMYDVMAAIATAQHGTSDPVSLHAYRHTCRYHDHCNLTKPSMLPHEQLAWDYSGCAFGGSDGTTLEFASEWGFQSFPIFGASAFHRASTIWHWQYQMIVS